MEQRWTNPCQITQYFNASKCNCQCIFHSYPGWAAIDSNGGGLSGMGFPSQFFMLRIMDRQKWLLERQPCTKVCDACHPPLPPASQQSLLCPELHCQHVSSSLLADNSVRGNGWRGLSRAVRDFPATPRLGVVTTVVYVGALFFSINFFASVPSAFS